MVKNKKDLPLKIGLMMFIPMLCLVVSYPGVISFSVFVLYVVFYSWFLNYKMNKRGKL